MGLSPSFTLDDTLSSPSEEPLAPGLFLLPRDAPPDLFKLRSHPRADLPSIKSLFPSSYIPYSERDSSGASSLLPVPKPQRKCASCNTRESSEWRPGPDGPRTLCDPCGLYYAELLLKRNKVGGRISQTMLYVHRPDSLPPRRSRRKRAALVTLS
ncbi:hypothetical protein C8R46DRAFT_1113383 [Mycena filopes]|nr:hypothetical protein C8R46DRAFT_1113383 [Mycena filopes]